MQNLSCQSKVDRIAEIDRIIGHGMTMPVVYTQNILKYRQERNRLVEELRSYKPKGAS